MGDYPLANDIIKSYCPMMYNGVIVLWNNCCTHQTVVHIQNIVINVNWPKRVMVLYGYLSFTILSMVSPFFAVGFG